MIILTTIIHYTSTNLPALTPLYINIHTRSRPVASSIPGVSITLCFYYLILIVWRHPGRIRIFISRKSPHEEIKNKKIAKRSINEIIIVCAIGAKRLFVENHEFW